MMKLCIYLLLVSTAAAQVGSSVNSQPLRNVDETLAETLITSNRQSVNSPPASSSNSETCTTPINEPGICGPLSQCPQYIPLVSQLGDPDTNKFFRSRICRILSRSLHICCPVNFPVVTKPTTTTNGILPPEDECGVPSGNKIIGGSEIRVGSWPWLAAVGWPIQNNGFSASCGGTLITKRHVLSAAHCFLPLLPTLTHVRLGEHHLRSNSDGAFPQDIRIASHATNGYNPTSKENDIELLILEQDAIFDDFVRPACLPINPSERDDNFEGQNAIVIGWGRIIDAEAAPTSDIPMQADVQIQSLEECSFSYRTRVLGTIVDPRNICAGQGPTDACNGDSGGPLNYLNEVNGRYYVIGIVSHGVYCGSSEFPGVYTRVGSFVDWILNNLKDQ